MGKKIVKFLVKMHVLGLGDNLDNVDAMSDLRQVPKMFLNFHNSFPERK